MKHIIVGLALALMTVPVARAATIYDKDPVFVSTFDLNTGEDYVYRTFLDHTRGHVYFVTYGTPGRIVKFKLATESSPAQRVGVVDLPAELEDLYGDCAVLDEARGYIYAAGSSTPGRVAKVKVNGPDDAPTLLGFIELEAAEGNVYSLALDPINEHLYVCSYASPGFIVKVATGQGDALPARLGAMATDATEHYPFAIAVDPAQTKGWYFSFDTVPYRVVQFNLGDGSAPPTRESVTVLVPGLDDNNGYYRMRYNPLDQTLILVGSYPSPNYPNLLKLDVSGAEPRIIGRLLADAENFAVTDFDIDPASGLGFGSGDISNARLLKVLVGSRFAGPGQIASVVIPPGNNIFIESIGYDQFNRFIYLTEDELEPARVYVFRQPAGDGPSLGAQFLKSAQKGAPGKVTVSGQILITNGTAQNAGLFFVRFFLSDDMLLSADDVQLGKDRLIKSLKAGKSRKVPFAGKKLPASAAGKFVIAVVDPQGLVDTANPGEQRIVSPQLQ